MTDQLVLPAIIAQNGAAFPLPVLIILIVVIFIVGGVIFARRRKR
jgi:hypothetical protein